MLHAGLYCKVLDVVASSDHNLSVNVIFNERNDDQNKIKYKKLKRLVRQRCITGWWNICIILGLFGHTGQTMQWWTELCKATLYWTELGWMLKDQSRPCSSSDIFGRLIGSAAWLNVLKNAESEEIPPVSMFQSQCNHCCFISLTQHCSCPSVSVCSFKWHLWDQDKLEAFPSYFSL